MTGEVTNCARKDQQINNTPGLFDQPGSSISENQTGLPNGRGDNSMWSTGQEKCNPLHI